MENNNSINTVINSNLTVIESYLKDMLEGVQTAKKDIAEGKANSAVGALLGSDAKYSELKALFDATLIAHRNAELINNQ